jgi:Tol biopolymer transport system component
MLARVEIHETASWLTEPATVPAPLWSSINTGRRPVLSADGNRVAFIHTRSSEASNAVVIVDWVHDRILMSNLVARTVMARPALSGDGRFAVWVARGPGSHPTDQIWHAEVDTGKLTLVSVGDDPSPGGNRPSGPPSLSADGRYVAFASLADNLVPGDTNGASDVFLHDTLTRQTLLLSRTPGGKPASGWSLEPFFSADGRSLFFLSLASDLAPDDHNQALDLFKVDILPDSGLLLVLRRHVLAGRVELVWNASAGRNYAVEFKEDLETDWTRLPGQFSGEAPVEFDPATAVRRFFRVVELPGG